MNPSHAADHIVFLCDDSGKIRRVLHDGLGLAHAIQRDLLFPSIVHRDSLGKSLNFLLEIRTNDSAVGWEFNISFGEVIQTYCFAGFKDNQDIRIIGSRSQKDLLECLGNWQENQDRLRASIKNSLRQSIPSDFLSENESVYCDELTRMYNEISNMYRELAKQKTELERLDELKNQFLGMAAHDLRTSLWTIQMFSQFLLEEIRDSLSERQLKLLSTIMEISELSKNIVGNYLDIAIIESGKFKLELKPTDLVELSKNCVELNQILAANKQIRLNLTYESLPELNVDHVRIEQVLNNLIHNAIKFSPPLTEINIHLYRSGSEAIIQVRDEGIGIPKDIIQILFEPFEGRRTQSTDEERGSGLGLAIARKVVHEHGGKVWVESEIGEGSTFYLALPIAGTAES